MMDKLTEIENKYIIHNEWAWSPYIDLVYKEHLVWLIQQAKLIKRTRLIQGRIINIQTKQLKQAKEVIRLLNSEIRSLKAKTSFKVYEENLRLAIENKELRERLQGKPIQDWTDF